MKGIYTTCIFFYFNHKKIDPPDPSLPLCVLVQKLQQFCKQSGPSKHKFLSFQTSLLCIVLELLWEGLPLVGLPRLVLIFTENFKIITICLITKLLSIPNNFYQGSLQLCTASGSGGQQKCCFIQEPAIFRRNPQVCVGFFGLSFTDRCYILYRGPRHRQNIFINFYLF